MYVEYCSNNSGGGWWLTDEDWLALEQAGGEVSWVNDDPDRRADANGRWLGALATRAVRRGLSLRDAADEWEQITHQTATDPGCSCCGQPHEFTEYTDDDKFVRSGPDLYTVGRWD